MKKATGSWREGIGRSAKKCHNSQKAGVENGKKYEKKPMGSWVTKTFCLKKVVNEEYDKSEKL